MTNKENSGTISVLVLDGAATRYCGALAEWDALTLLACVSDDPTNWSELAQVWPRSATADSAEFADALPLQDLELSAAMEQLDAATPWLVIDLPQRRILTGGGFEEFPRDCYFDPDEEASQRSRQPAYLSVHLPPWWILDHQAEVAAIAERRSEPLRLPQPRRDVLWGPQLAEGLASRLCQAFRSEDWLSANCDSDRQARYAQTVAVHRDWLMTPHDDLQGRIPRECLHDGRKWVELVIETQLRRISKQQPPVPLPQEMQASPNVPFGREEVCLYFDCCRELIDFGWEWLVAHRGSAVSAATPEANVKPETHASATSVTPATATSATATSATATSATATSATATSATATSATAATGPIGEESQVTQVKLAQALAERQHAWLHEPFEGSRPPAEMIETERCRVPGMSNDGGHVIDCDCPICM